jgi:putative peptide zinc metalloprotease protein
MRFPPDALVKVHVSARQAEGAETIFGRSDIGVFLVIPTEALVILDELAARKTVGEAQAAFQSRYGEQADMEEFLGYLERKGLVELATPGAESRPVPVPIRFHLAHFPETLAQQLFSKTSIRLCLGIIAVALTAIFLDPGVLPSWQALYIHKNMAVMTFVLTILYYTAVLLHEMAHLIAARAVGVVSRFGISHRLWFLVAQTDMSGLWAVPRQKRYLPILAGPLVDATSASLLVILLFGFRRGWWVLSDSVQLVGRALLFIFILGLLWQCFLFVRTDLYYAVSNFFGCKNLLGDTEALLRAMLGRLLPFISPRDAPDIPARELRVVKAYIGIWLLGRVVALAVLVLVYIPIIYHYVTTVAATLAAGYKADHHAFLDALVATSIVLAPLFAGWWLWLRSLLWKPISTILAL